MKVVISNVPRSIHDTTDYSILESFYFVLLITKVFKTRKSIQVQLQTKKIEEGQVRGTSNAIWEWQEVVLFIGKIARGKETIMKTKK
jgi:hypothetical protein